MIHFNFIHDSAHYNSPCACQISPVRASGRVDTS